jgi:hypothetical protein
MHLPSVPSVVSSSAYSDPATTTRRREGMPWEGVGVAGSWEGNTSTQLPYWFEIEGKVSVHFRGHRFRDCLFPFRLAQSV